MSKNGKSINGIMKHIRDNHNIEIGGSKEKSELLNMGYFHSFKAYKFNKNIRNPLHITEFKQISYIYELDNQLKALLYPIIMKIENSLNSYTINCVTSNRKSNVEDVINECANHYKDFDSNTSEFKKEMQNYLNLKKNINQIISKNYKKSKMIQHYANNGKSIPIWALFELTTLGDLGDFILRLNNETRLKLSLEIGVYDSRYDTGVELLSKHIFMIKELRNAVAHNNPIFDCRFKTRSIANTLKRHLEDNTNVQSINFEKITDYLILLIYYMKSMKYPKSEIKKIINNYTDILNKYENRINNQFNFISIFGVDSMTKINNLYESI